MRRSFFLIILLLAVLPDALAAEDSHPVLISAAASLKDALTDLIADYTKTHPGGKTDLNLGATGVLELQIRQGAPADIFVGAAPQNLERLNSEGLLTSDSMRIWCRNRLTLLLREPVNAEYKTRDPQSVYAFLLRPQIKKIAVGAPKSVPAGQYTEQLLRKEGLWDALLPKFIYAENVRQALAWVEQGEVDAGFVYVTDAALAKRAIRSETTAPDFPRIEYAIALTKRGGANPSAREVFTFLTGQAGQQALARRGFLPAAP